MELNFDDTMAKVKAIFPDCWEDFPDQQLTIYTCYKSKDIPLADGSFSYDIIVPFPEAGAKTPSPELDFAATMAALKAIFPDCWEDFPDEQLVIYTRYTSKDIFSADGSSSHFDFIVPMPPPEPFRSNFRHVFGDAIDLVPSRPTHTQ